MPSSKRKPRRKAAEMQETSEMEVPDSSPSKPSAKKRKVNGTRTSAARRSFSPVKQEDDSGDESETVSNSDLVDSVISYLQVSKDPVMATIEHSNEKNEPDNVQKVSAYAKIAGKEWTYFVKEQSVNIGRPPDGNKDGNVLSASASSPVPELDPMANLKETLPCHIDLGPSKIVSRHHASVFYDADYPEGGGWHVRVNGRNGVKVNMNLLKRGGTQQLRSGDILEIAGTQMMFVTPNEKVVINPFFVERAKERATGEELTTTHHGQPDQALKPPPGYAFSNGNGRQPLAPAPPRANTPPLSQKGAVQQQGVFDSRPPQSPMYNRGMMMESTSEIDYSRDAAKDLKPPFSYATMIAQAIFSSEEEKLTLNNIYGWIADKYAFYRHSNSGWQNSIRHNLSLNKAFQKVPRRTDEPGKGMKWQIAPEFRDEYWKKQARRGATQSSSVPTSPAGGKDVHPNFRGPNGQNLGFDTSMVGSFPAKDLAPLPPVPPHPSTRNAFNSFAPPQPQPQPQIHHGHPQPPPGASTPDRRQSRKDTIPDPDFDDSPLPRHMLGPTPAKLPTYTLPSSIPPPHHSPSNPTLSSSYLDTPFRNAGPIITPAPLRQNPRLAPPSTLVAPSKFMPDSSPAGPAGLFWKGLMIGNTPAHGLPDISPVKGDPADDGRGVMSSSPPPMDGPGGISPSKPGRSSSQQVPSSSSAKKVNGITDEDDDAGMGGFDLARGFQPIGSFHSHTNNGGNAARASS